MAVTFIRPEGEATADSILQTDAQNGRQNHELLHCAALDKVWGESSSLFKD
jgi:hypothetical protein